MLPVILLVTVGSPGTILTTSILLERVPHSFPITISNDYIKLGVSLSVIFFPPSHFPATLAKRVKSYPEEQNS